MVGTSNQSVPEMASDLYVCWLHTSFDEIYIQGTYSKLVGVNLLFFTWIDAIFPPRLSVENWPKIIKKTPGYP